MDITPPRLPLDSLLKRLPMTVYTVSYPPAEAVARCAQFWRAIGIKRESTTMCKRFADIGWSGTEVTVMPGQVTASRRRNHDTLLDVAEISPALALGGLAIHLSAKAVRAQLRHLNKTTIIIAARPLPDAEQACTELWCFPWDTAIQRARPGKDPFARVFEYLHTALHQQGILATPPRLVDGEELPEDHPLSPANIAQMRGITSVPFSSLFPGKKADELFHFKYAARLQRIFQHDRRFSAVSVPVRCCLPLRRSLEGEGGPLHHYRHARTIQAAGMDRNGTDHRTQRSRIPD